jgi:hypothetical protein
MTLTFQEKEIYQLQSNFSTQANTEKGLVAVLGLRLKCLGGGNLCAWVTLTYVYI